MQRAMQWTVLVALVTGLSAPAFGAINVDFSDPLDFDDLIGDGSELVSVEASGSLAEFNLANRFVGTAASGQHGFAGGGSSSSNTATFLIDASLNIQFFSLIVSAEPASLGGFNQKTFVVTAFDEFDNQIGSDSDVVSKLANNTDINGKVISIATISDDIARVEIAWDNTVVSDGGGNVSLLFDNLTLAVPEPASLALLGLGGLAMTKRRVR